MSGIYDTGISSAEFLDAGLLLRIFHIILLWRKVCRLHVTLLMRSRQKWSKCECCDNASIHLDLSVVRTISKPESQTSLGNFTRGSLMLYRWGKLTAQSPVCHL